MLASLNHPNIAQIHGIEQSALVRELVEGDDLSLRISRGAIPLDEALPIAKHIAEAFEAAREQGIIDRDLKPANITFYRSCQSSRVASRRPPTPVLARHR